MPQTDSYLEQLTDVVAETEMSTQTDPFRDRPSTPLFIPAKAGLDAITQTEAGYLFDFDSDVSLPVCKRSPQCLLCCVYLNIAILEMSVTHSTNTAIIIIIIKLASIYCSVCVAQVLSCQAGLS